MKKYGNGAKVGNITVFSQEGAVKAYVIFCEIFNREMTMEASVVASKAANDMHNLGFTWDEIEKIEISTLQ